MSRVIEAMKALVIGSSVTSRPCLPRTEGFPAHKVFSPKIGTVSGTQDGWPPWLVGITATAIIYITFIRVSTASFPKDVAALSPCVLYGYQAFHKHICPVDWSQLSARGIQAWPILPQRPVWTPPAGRTLSSQRPCAPKEPWPPH